MGSRWSDRMLIAPGEAAQHVSQWQEQADRGSQNHVEPEKLPPLENFLGGVGGGSAMGGEGEAGEGQKISGGECWEDEVKQWDETAGREDHDEGY